MLVAEKKGPATYADIEALPEHLVGEIIDGELIVGPRPAPPHALAESHLLVELGGPFDRGKGGPGGWIILGEPELHLGPQVLVPDVAGWRRERMPRLPTTPFFELPPDWLCEVLSPSTARVDRAKKMRHYATAKVQHVWLLDPLATTLEVFRLDAGGWLRIEAYAGDEKVRAEPFDAVELDLSTLWEPR
ncbi:MAG TPA: Uma2 family endonuclease [Polyangia bacterium]|nr:Uma2 family endonuclease [Polyangia bacterium]